MEFTYEKSPGLDVLKMRPKHRPRDAYIGSRPPDRDHVAATGPFYGCRVLQRG